MPRGQFDRSARKAQTRARLLEAAAQRVRAPRLRGATLDEVAAEAGFTKGAVYAHFGSKENLLLALAGGAPRRAGRRAARAVRPRSRSRGSVRSPAATAGWTACSRVPTRFRLFVELWTHAQRDEPLRVRLAEGLGALRATFTRFSADSAADAGVEAPPEGAEQFANVMLGLGVGFAMLKLTDPQALSPALLGVVLSVLIRSMETNPEARELIGGLVGELGTCPGSLGSMSAAELASVTLQGCLS